MPKIYDIALEAYREVTRKDLLVLYEYVNAYNKLRAEPDKAEQIHIKLLRQIRDIERTEDQSNADI